MYSQPDQTLTLFASDNGLTDAWVQLEYGGAAARRTDVRLPASCGQPGQIFYRDAAPLNPGDPATSPVHLRALEYTNEGLNFLNEAIADLSANRPQSVTFGYSVDTVGPMNVDMANWMASCPRYRRAVDIATDPRHDSGGYGITAQSPWALTGKDQFGFLTELPASCRT